MPSKEYPTRAEAFFGVLIILMAFLIDVICEALDTLKSYWPWIFSTGVIVVATLILIHYN